jgi:hypothetical protein
MVFLVSAFGQYANARVKLGNFHDTPPDKPLTASINLPFGGLAIALITAFQPLKPPLGRADSYKGFSLDMIGQVVRCDWGGAIISMAWACCLILFMQWGGVTRPWNDGGVITCIVLSAVLIPVFIAYEYWLGEKAMFKMKLLKRRTIA